MENIVNLSCEKKKPAMFLSDDAFEADLSLRIRDFIAEKRFILDLQPIYDFASDRICGCEVLSRLNHPDLGLVYPGRFLPVINALHLQLEFDRYVFTESCRWLRQLQDSGRNLKWLTCNFSRKTLGTAGIAEELVRISDSFGISRPSMGIELTEQESADDEELFYENVRRLKEYGFLILIDDMGSGVTSRQELNRIPADIVKIDRSILVNAVTEEGVKAFRELVQLINRVGAEALGEGIERYGDFRLVRGAGCAYGQGYLFAPPTSTRAIEDMLDNWTR